MSTSSALAIARTASSVACMLLLGHHGFPDCFFQYIVLGYQSYPVSCRFHRLASGAPNDGIFPNASEVSEIYHSVLGKPV